MRNYSQKEGSLPLCTASTGSMTAAIKARRILSARGFEVKVKKLSAAKDSRGCIYGIEFSCELSGNILSILQNAGMEVYI